MNLRNEFSLAWVAAAMLCAVLWLGESISSNKFGAGPFFGLVVKPANASAQSNVKPELPRDNETGWGLPSAIKNRFDAVALDLKAIDSANASKLPFWTGKYYKGDGLGENVNLAISPANGVAVSWFGCLGLYGANEGTVQEQLDGALQLDFRWRNNANDFGGFDEMLLPLQWGQRSYLVSLKEIDTFVKWINLGYEPKQTRMMSVSLMREGDENRPASGLPKLPPKYQGLLRTSPALFPVIDWTLMTSKMIDSKRCQMTWQVQFDTKNDPNLFAGMRLAVNDQEWEDVEITTIEGNLGTATFQGMGDSHCKNAKLSPSKDWVLHAAYIKPDVLRKLISTEAP